MTTPLVFKAFNLIEKLNNYSYPYLLSWDPVEKKLNITEKTTKLIPWHIANIGVVFILHFCLSLFTLGYQSSSEHAMNSTKDALQLGALVMMSCHSTASYGQNFLIFSHAHVFVPFYNALLQFEIRVRGRYITNKEIRAASMMKELSPKKLANSEADIGLVMHFIIHTLTVVPAITPLSLVIEDLDPFGIFLKKVLIPKYDLLSVDTKMGLIILRIGILTVAMIEVSQTFRTIFNFGMSVIHIYNKCLAAPILQTWNTYRTLSIYNQLRVIHTGMIPFFSPLGAFFLGLNFVILTLSTVLCLKSHKYLPIQIYVGIPAATAMAYFLLFATLPFAIHCHEETQKLLLKWYRGLVVVSPGRIKYWKKILATLKPIAFYCGSTGILTQQTKRIYISSVIDGTVNVLLMTG